MLTELHIEDLGVIDTLHLVFGAGLTALTGETGAGKTMLVEAISLLVGGRADAGIVRPGATEARVEGRFVMGEEEFILARVVPGDGRSRAYLNGRLATVAQLAEVGAQLVDLHGQHAHQSLLATATQRSALDRFGAIDTDPLRLCRVQVRDIDAALAALGGDTRARAREIDLLRFQVNELDAAALNHPDEESELDAQEDVLAGAVAHREVGAAGVEALSGDGGALDLLGAATSALAQRVPFAALAERLRSATVEISEVAAELRDVAEAIEEDPQRLIELRLRRQMLRDLRRKYGETLAEVFEFHRLTAERLEELEGYEQRAAVLEHERANAVANLARAEQEIGSLRRAAAPRLATAVKEHLQRLAMPHADLAVVVGDDPGDDVSFLLAANPGSPLTPLAKVASGGELARSMLALRLVLSEDPSALVFDEVDAGIGGAAAISIGQALAKLAQQHQVLVVTHLAQVAACATHQIVVSKDVRDGATFASAVVTTGEDRVQEIARMLSGLNDSKSAREHAVELLEQRCAVS
jgi:DNA repair protein RecN (Recombination protein N)